ncbi:MAG: YceI family protein [Phycisphaerales bacterium]|nr:YceI family protein [Phycisphaerales bacterium]MCI0630436.1 YceI family protein [Phycisphaerales bacterium]MCI0676372.1 YceI family protein [Phycisphaerales bacterium]
MKTRTLLGIAALGIVLAASIGLAPQDVRPAMRPAGGAEAFTADSVHSSLVFKIQHVGVTNFYGRFNDITGKFSIDAANPSLSQFDFQVKTDSVDTGSEKRDGHLKSLDFFNAAEYPTISFKSTKVVKGDNNQFKVTGDLSLHGVTKPIGVAVTSFGAKQTVHGHRGGFEGVFTIKRSEFGMDYAVADGTLGDDVQVTVAVEGIKQ